MHWLESCLGLSVQVGVDHSGLSLLFAGFLGFPFACPPALSQLVGFRLLRAELVPWPAPHTLEVPSSLVISKALL